MTEQQINPVVMQRDQQRIDSHKETLSELAALVNGTLTAFNDLEAGELSLENIKQLTAAGANPDRFARERKVGGKTAKVASLSINTESLMQMLDINTGRFASLLNAIAEHIKKSRSYPHQSVTLDMLELVDGMAFEKQEALETIERTYSTLAETDREQSAYADAQRIFQQLEEFTATYGFRLVGHDKNDRFAVIKQNVNPYESNAASFDVTAFKSKLRETQG